MSILEQYETEKSTNSIDWMRGFCKMLDVFDIVFKVTLYIVGLAVFFFVFYLSRKIGIALLVHIDLFFYFSLIASIVLILTSIFREKNDVVRRELSKKVLNYCSLFFFLFGFIISYPYAEPIRVSNSAEVKIDISFILALFYFIFNKVVNK